MDTLALDSLSLEEVRELAQASENPSISIYMPTHRGGPEVQQDPVRLKNLLRTVEQSLVEKGMDHAEAGQYLEAAQALLDNDDFWQQQGDGLALFMALNDFHSYRLPFPVDELVTITGSFYIMPLLRLFTDNGHYYILALSQHDVRLFEATRYSINQLDLPEGTPQSIGEALREDRAEPLEIHSGALRGSAHAGEYHGQSGAGEEHRNRKERYLNLVDKGLQKYLNNQRAPLVLAGVEYLLPLYRKVSDYAAILDEGITGNPELLSPQELQEKAWPVVQRHFHQEIENLLEQYQQFVASGQASDKLEEIVAAASYGRVETLMVAMNAQVWGTFDAETGKVVQHAEEQKQENDFALLDFAAAQTLQNSGMVYTLPAEEMPTDSPILALFRY